MFHPKSRILRPDMETIVNDSKETAPHKKAAPLGMSAASRKDCKRTIAPDARERPVGAPDAQDVPSQGSKAAKRSRKRRASRAVNGAGTLVLHGKYYQARWQVNGKVIAKSLKTSDPDEARAIMARMSVPRAGLEERETLRKIQSVMASTLADVSEQMKAVSIPVGDLFRLFSEAPNRNEVGERTLNVYGGQFNVLADWIRAHHPEITNARDISQGVADEYARWRAETKSPNTHNKDLNLFAQAWRILSGRFGLDYNPWTEERIARLKLKPNGRRNLTRKECRKVIAAATVEERAMILLALMTALRLGDVVRITWDRIDFARKWVWKVTNRKTGKMTSVPMVAPLAKALKAWKAETPESPEGYVFPDMVARLKDDGDTENISRIFTRLFRRAGIETSVEGEDGKMHPVATFHSLRHTFITNLMEAGVDPLLVRDAAGHSVMATTAGYTHIGEAALRKALTKASR